jgi:hypothetical protein
LESLIQAIRHFQDTRALRQDRTAQFALFFMVGAAFAKRQVICMKLQLAFEIRNN